MRYIFGTCTHTNLQQEERGGEGRGDCHLARGDCHLAR